MKEASWYFPDGNALKFCDMDAICYFYKDQSCFW